MLGLELERIGTRLGIPSKVEGPLLRDDGVAGRWGGGDSDSARTELGRGEAALDLEMQPPMSTSEHDVLPVRTVGLIEPAALASGEVDSNGAKPVMVESFRNGGKVWAVRAWDPKESHPVQRTSIRKCDARR
jgi:hypothetical protein